MTKYVNADELFQEDFTDFWHDKADQKVFENILIDAPTADVVEVRHGKWKIKQDDFYCEYMMCSCCKEEFYPDDADTVDTTPNYCPNCGAKMDGERKEQK